MLRNCLLIVGLLAATSSGGCRSCSTCHDYGPPVANCDCNAYGVHRAGSASGCAGHGGYVDGGYAAEGYYPADGEMIQQQPDVIYEEPTQAQPAE